MKEVIFNKQNVKRVVTIALVMAMILTMLPGMAVTADAASMDDYLFDWEYYYNKYPDLQKAFGKNQSKLRNHYNTCGKREGRSSSDVFDPGFYLSKYSDLKAAFGSDYVAAYNHFVNRGIMEGRQASASFSIEVYKSNYADLRSAFGTAASDNWEYIRHWYQYGRKEGRNAISKISTTGNTSNANTTATSTMYVKTSNPNNRLNLRASASTSSNIVAKLSYGTKVTVYSTTNGWANVNADGKVGYVSTQYLSSTKPSNTVSTQEDGVKYTYTTLTLDTSSLQNWVKSLMNAQSKCDGMIVEQTVNETRPMQIVEPLQGPPVNGKNPTKTTTVNAPYRITLKIHKHQRNFGFAQSWRYADECLVVMYQCDCGFVKEIMSWQIPIDLSRTAEAQIIDTINKQASQSYWINNVK